MMKADRRKTGKRSQSVFDIPKNAIPSSSLQSSVQRINFARLLTELHDEIQEKDAAIKAAEQFHYELGEKLDMMETERIRLTSQLEKSQSELQSSREENEHLRITIEDLEESVSALQNVTHEKEESLGQMAKDLHYFESETEAYRFNQGRSNSLLLQVQKEKHKLTVEVANTKRNSIYVKRQAEDMGNQLRLLYQQLKAAENEKTKLTQEIMEVKKVCTEFQQENFHIREEIETLKSMYDHKTFELIDAQRELESLRAVGNKQEEDGALAHLRLSHCESSERDPTRGGPSECSGQITPIGVSPRESPTSVESRQKTLLVMMNEVNIFDLENKTSESEAEEDYCDGDRQRASEPEVVQYAADPWVDSKNDMLLVYLYLTAAAVKCNYPDVEIKNSYLIQLGQDMPFWRLYPYFDHVFQTLKKKEKCCAENEARRRRDGKNGGWFKWMLGKGQSARYPPTVVE